MCGFNYYTHEAVEKAFKTITAPSESAQAENVKQITAAEKLIGEQIPFLGVSALNVGAGNPVQTVKIALTAGFLLGLRLAGTSHLINPDQEYSEKVQSIMAQVEANQYEGVAATAAAA